MIIDQLFTQPLFEDIADPNRLIVSVTIQPMSTGGEPIKKEIDLTGQFQGNTRSQMEQAMDYLTKMLESKGLNFTTLQARYQGSIMNQNNQGTMAPQSDWEREAEAKAAQMRAQARAQRPVQNATPAIKESAADPITQFASNAHEEWRRNFDPTGTKPRIKKNSDGTEGDINVPFEKLHPDWKKENLAAGHAAHHAVKHFGRDMEKAAEHVHNEWMKRNPKADYNAAQHVPYDDLSDDEKEKDRVHVRTMMRLMGHQLNEFAPSDDGEGPDQEELLRRLAAHWWNGNDHAMTRVEHTLAAMGWEIGQDEGYDDGGVFVVRAGDEHGRTYTSWSADELEMNESGLRKFSHKKNRFKSLDKLRNPLGEEDAIDPSRRGFLKKAAGAAVAGAAMSAAGPEIVTLVKGFAEQAGGMNGIQALKAMLKIATPAELYNMYDYYSDSGIMEDAITQSDMVALDRAGYDDWSEFEEHCDENSVDPDDEFERLTGQPLKVKLVDDILGKVNDTWSLEDFFDQYPEAMNIINPPRESLLSMRQLANIDTAAKGAHLPTPIVAMANAVSSLVRQIFKSNGQSLAAPQQSAVQHARHTSALPAPTRPEFDMTPDLKQKEKVSIQRKGDDEEPEDPSLAPEDPKKLLQRLADAGAYSRGALQDIIDGTDKSGMMTKERAQELLNKHYDGNQDMAEGEVVAFSKNKIKPPHDITGDDVEYAWALKHRAGGKDKISYQHNGVTLHHPDGSSTFILGGHRSLFDRDHAGKLKFKSDLSAANRSFKMPTRSAIKNNIVDFKAKESQGVTESSHDPAKDALIQALMGHSVDDPRELWVDLKHIGRKFKTPVSKQIRMALPSLSPDDAYELWDTALEIAGVTQDDLDNMTDDMDDSRGVWDGNLRGVSEGLTEMDKSQTPPGRDGGPRPGPEKIAKPITKEKMVKHTLDALTKSMAKKDDKKKDVKESDPLMLKLRRALIKEGRVKELALDLKTMPDSDFMKKYGKAKAAIRKDMKRVDEAAQTNYTPQEMTDILSGKKTQQQVDAERAKKIDDQTDDLVMRVDKQGRRVDKNGKLLPPPKTWTNPPINPPPGKMQQYEGLDEQDAAGQQFVGTGTSSNWQMSVDIAAMNARKKAAQSIAGTNSFQGVQLPPGTKYGPQDTKSDGTGKYVSTYTITLPAPSQSAEPPPAAPAGNLDSSPATSSMKGSMSTTEPAAAGAAAGNYMKVNELSTNKLSQYKTAAAKDAKKADQAGDFKRGDKRLGGMVQATKKQFDNDAKKVDESRAARRALMARIVNAR